MKNKSSIWMLLVAIFLVSCNAGSHKEQRVVASEALGNGLYYSYPLQGQTEVAPSAPIVLSFLKKQSIKQGDFRLEFSNGSIDHFSIDATDGGKGVFMLPLDASGEPLRLTANTLYTLKSDTIALPDDGISFQTRPAVSGGLTSRSSSDEFKVEAVSPDEKKFQLMDFSSINVTLSQPMDELTASYGGSIQLLQAGKLVEASLAVKGRKITIDPDGDLAPGQPVDLVVTQQLLNRSGKPIKAFAQSLTPQDTQPRETTVLQAQSPDGCNLSLVDPSFVSALSGKPVNCVPLISSLLGGTIDNPSSVSTVNADVYGELGFAPRFPNSTPLRLKKGTILQGTSLPIKIGGEVDVGFESGNLRATIISDANGYIFDNPYTDNPDVPKIMVLTADLALSTEDPRANGAFSQIVMHATLLGKAIVDTQKGELIGNALGVVEPSVLGIERGFGVLSLRISSYPDQDNLPPGVPRQQPEDSTPFKLSSWVPGDKDLKPGPNDVTRINIMPIVEDQGAFGGPDSIADMLNPDDPIILKFNKPVDQGSIHKNDSLTVTKNGQPIDFDWKVNSTAINIYPKPALEFSDDLVQPNIYRVSYSGLMDTGGHEPQPHTVTFAMPVYVQPDEGQAPYDATISSVYPGFPCVTAPASLDLANASQGYCESHPADGVNDINDENGRIHNGKNDMSGEPVDELPILSVPANRELRTRFSQPMKPASFDDGFKVEQCESLLSCDEPTLVLGERRPFGKTLVFIPQQSWEPGKLYRQIFYGDKVETIYGGKLMTAPLNGATDSNPRADLVIYFYGAERSKNAFKGLRNLPTSDLNGNFKHDEGEPEPSGDSDPATSRANFNSVSFRIKETDGTIVTDAVPVCSSEVPNCKDPEKSYITLSLNAEFEGFKTPAEVTQVEQASGFDAPDLVKQNGGFLAYIFPSQMIASALTLKATVLGLIDKVLATDRVVLRIRYTCDAKEGGCKDVPKNGLIPAWLYNDANGDTRISVTLNAYFDAPAVAPTVTAGDVPGLDTASGLSDLLNTIGLGGTVSTVVDALGLENDTIDALTGALDGGVPVTTDLHSKVVGRPIVASGPVNALPDGRLQIELLNNFDEQVPASVDIGGIGAATSGGEGLGTMLIEIPRHSLDANFITAPVVY